MAILRVNKTKDYTVMSNYHFKEKEMSLKAKGLLSQMLSLPEDWDYSIAGLVAINKENESSIKSTLNELKKFGYLEITKLMPNQTKTGRIEYVYDIFENPKKQGVINQPIEKQEIEKQEVENQPLEFQPLENQGQYNIYNQINNNKVCNNKINKINNNQQVDKECLSREQEILEKEFERLWKLYPRKEGKAKAFKSYCKFRKSTKDDYVTSEEVEDGIEAYIRYIKANKIDPKYIKQGATWFGNRCWEDEYPEVEKADVPEWFYKEIEENPATEEEIDEITALLKRHCPDLHNDECFM